jgi:membrane protein DedA with SNARE-associated domain
MIFSILSAISSFAIDFIENTGYLGITVLMALESANIPIPSEIIMPFSGFIVSLGGFSFWLVVLVGSLGNLLGSILGYALGYFGGRPFVKKYGKYFLISNEELEKSERWFSKYGSATAFFGRMLPIVRTFISTPAGVAKMNFKKFCIFTFLGAIPWSIFLTFIGLKLGENWQSIEVYFKKFDFVIAIIILIGFGWWIFNRVKNFKNNSHE